MPRRVGLPGASELFRSTAPEARSDAPRPLPAADRPPRRPDAGDGKASKHDKAANADAASVAHTGRVRHDEKITIYVSSEELLALEHLRLQLRGEHGIAVDRGRIVRAALASALEDVNAHGADADVVKRLLGL